MKNLGKAQADWLLREMSEMQLSDEAEGYLYGRGACESMLQELGFVIWRTARDASPDPQFTKIYGPRGEHLEGWLVCPIKVPTGQIVGLNCRNIEDRKYSRYRSELFPWAPTLAGIDDVLAKASSGGSVWLVEGIYDMLPLRWSIPEGDAVASTLTARLSGEQAEWLARFCKKRVYVVYDMDSTGKKAAGFAVRALQKLGVNAIRWDFIGGKDPGEVWDKGGVTAVRRQFSSH